MTVPATTSARWHLVVGAALLLGAGIASCSGSATGDLTGPPTTGQVASVVVTPSASSLTIGATLPLQVAVQDQSGQPASAGAVFWSSSDTTVATVSSHGVVTARAVGTAQIDASASGHSAIAAITVIQVPVASVAVVPGTGTVSVGSSMTLAAVAYDGAGSSLSGRQVVWASSAPAIARVDANGSVTGVAAGSAEITATSEGKRGSATITVVLVPVAAIAVSPGSLTLTTGQASALAATATDANGNVLAGRGLVWSSSNPAIATVAASGLVTAVSVGTANITATSEGHSATVQVVVSAPPPATPLPPAAVSSITVTPPSAAVTVGGSIALAATTADAKGNVLTGRTITWSSSAPQIATITASGVVTGIAAGTVTITAASEGKTAVATITVAAPPPPPPAAVAAVTVTPASVTLAVGGAATLAAAARDADGNALPGRSVTWSSGAQGVVSVSSSGVVTAVSPGTATVTATSEGKSGTAQITVNAPPPAPVASVTVTPTNDTVAIGSTAALSATTRDASGHVLTGRTVTWTSSAPSVATVSSSGVVTGVTTGTATITALSEGRSGTASVVVRGVVDHLVATPVSITMARHSDAALRVAVYDAQGNQLTGHTITWSSSDSAIVTVSATGALTAQAHSTKRTGTARITATCEGEHVDITVTVTEDHGD